MGLGFWAQGDLRVLGGLGFWGGLGFRAFSLLCFWLSLASRPQGAWGLGFIEIWGGASYFEHPKQGSRYQDVRVWSLRRETLQSGMLEPSKIVS